MRYAGTGLTFALTILVLGFVGWWLDERLGTRPWLMILGILAGFVGGLISMVKRIPPPTGKPRS